MIFTKSNRLSFKIEIFFKTLCYNVNQYNLNIIRNYSLLLVKKRSILGIVQRIYLTYS